MEGRSTRTVAVAALLACVGCASAAPQRRTDGLTSDLRAEQACIVHEIAVWNPSITLISAKCSRGQIVERTEPMLAWLFSSPKFRAKYATAVQVLSWQMRQLDAAMARGGDPLDTPIDTRSYQIGETPASDASDW
jgi:hypothetical protein